MRRRIHRLTYSDSPIGKQVLCSCGWTHFVRRKNTDIDAEKMKAAINRHKTAGSRNGLEA